MFDHIQRSQGPQDPKMVKLEMIFYKTGYTRIPRVVSITGAYKCWNNETLSFESASSEYLKKNQLLLEVKEKYMSVAERCTYKEIAAAGAMGWQTPSFISLSSEILYFSANYHRNILRFPTKYN